MIPPVWKEGTTDLVDHGHKEDKVGSHLDEERAQRVHSRSAQLWRADRRRENACERVHDARGLVRKVDFATKLRDGPDRLLAQRDGHVRAFERAHDRGDDEVQVLLEAGPKDAERVEDLDEAVVPPRLVEVLVERLEHERQQVREVRLELGVQRERDRLNHIDDDDLEARIRGRRPEVAHGREDRR